MIILNWQQINEACKKIAIEFQDIKEIYPIPRGGLVPAVIISHLTGANLITEPSKTCLVIDDIADSGLTLKPFQNHKIATLINFTDLKIFSPIKLEKTWIIFPWEDEKKAIQDKKDYENKRNI